MIKSLVGLGCLAGLEGSKQRSAKLSKPPKPIKLVSNEPDKVLAFLRGDLLFAFNFNPTQPFTDYGILVPPASKWRHLFDTDEVRFGGQGRVQAGAVYEPALVHDSNHNEIVQQIKLYLPARTAVVLKRA